MKKMQLYQIYYNEYTKSKLSKYLIPYNNTNPTKPNEYEFGVMKDLYFQIDWSNVSHLGVLSWRFEEKTKIQVQNLVKYLKSNPIADIYIINPYPLGAPHEDNIFGYKNVWDQGDYWHPGLKNLACKIFESAGLDPNDINKTTSKESECYCNYWIANKKFWDLYISFTLRIYDAIYSKKELYKEAFSKPCSKDPLNNALTFHCFFPYIFERLFSTILSGFDSSFKIIRLENL